METIIIGKEEIQNAKLKVYKKKIICYNEKREILIYEKENKIHIPTLYVMNLKNKQLQRKFKVQIQEDKLEDLVQIITCNFRFSNNNNKLVKNYLKYIKEYYTYLVDFHSIRDQLKSFAAQDGAFKPQILPIEDVMQLDNQFYTVTREQELAFQSFQHKRKRKSL